MERPTYNLYQSTRYFYFFLSYFDFCTWIIISLIHRYRIPSSFHAIIILRAHIYLSIILIHLFSKIIYVVNIKCSNFSSSYEMSWHHFSVHWPIGYMNRSATENSQKIEELFDRPINGIQISIYLRINQNPKIPESW